MAIQFTDFSRAPLLESPWKNMLENVFKGYQISKEPAKMREEQSARELANQLKKLEVEHKPKEFELSDQGKSLANALQSKALEHYEEKFGLDRELRKAQIQKALQTNVGGNPKANGELANYMVSHPNATPEEIRNAYEEIHGMKAENQESLINRRKDVTAGNSFDKLPVNDKKQAVALMKGMGADPVDAVRYLRQPGNSPSTYAKQFNIDINTVIPDYAAGEQNIKDAQRIDAYQKEISSFQQHITEGLGPFQNKIRNYSIEQIADAAEGKNTDKQAKALAARALMPELISLRLKVMGGNIGIEALRELESKSLGQLNIIEGLVDTKTYKAAQDYMTKWIEEAGDIRRRSLIGNSMLKTRLQKGAESESHEGKVYDLVTGRWENQ